MPALRFHNLTLGYERHPAVHHLDGAVESGALEAAFPNAKLIVQKGELETAREPGNERLNAAYRHMKEILAPTASSFEAIEGDTEIISGVTAAMNWP